MFGRITSVSDPATNPHGVSYLRLYTTEKNLSDHLLAIYRAALGAWIEADATATNSAQRKRLLKRARELTVAALS